MTKAEMLDKLRSFDQEKELRWMISLGAQLAIAARDGYPVQEKSGNVECLVAFNEMQHQIYGRIRHLSRGDEWAIESLLDGLEQKAKHYHVLAGFNLALSRSSQEI